MNYRVVPAAELSPATCRVWADLQRAHPELDAPYLRPELNQLVAATRDDIFVTVFEDGKREVGFFPFERDGDAGRPVAFPMSDMHGVVVAPTTRWDAAEMVRGSGLSVWHFDHLITTQEPLRRYHRVVEASPYMDLSEGFDAYQTERRAARSSLVSQGMRKARKLGREVGPLHFELHTGDRAMLALLTEWKRAQLLRSHFADIFRHRWFLDVMERLCSTESEALAGWLSVLRAGDTVVALHLGIRSHHVLSSWIPTYSAEHARYSPGLILHIELARAAAERGVTRIDLGRGENPLKMSLASGSIPVAIGDVELRPLHRLLSTGWYGARRLAHASPLGKTPRRIYRRLKNLRTRA